MFLQKFILSFLWNFIKFNLCLYAVEYGTEHGDMNAAAGNGNNTFDPANPDARERVLTSRISHKRLPSSVQMRTRLTLLCVICQRKAKRFSLLK